MSSGVPNSLEIHLLGEPEFRYGGQPLRFGAPPRALEVLAFVLLNRATPVARERVAFAVWPDSPADEARADLRRHLYYLTTRLLPAGVPWFVGDKRSIGWNPATPTWIDVAAIDAALVSPATQADAIALYRDHLLPRVDAEWLIPYRDGLRDRIVRAVDERLADADSQRNFDALLTLANRLLAIDPWNEGAIRAVVRARVAQGDRAGAAGAYRSFVRRLEDELGVAPMPETQQAYELAVGSAPARDRAEVPARLTSFIGRLEERNAVTALLDAEPIVTVTGPGGVGKTRLAQEVARAGAGHFAGGAAFVDLSTATNATHVLAAIANAVGVREEHGLDLFDAVAAALRRRDTLLIVDNCESALDATAGLLAGFAIAVARLRVLATSREPLRIEGEHVFRLDPLEASDAATLFADRARAAGPLETPAERDAETIARICGRLDNLPLAIELAAAQAHTLRLEEIAAGIDDRFGLLRGGWRTAPPRAQTLRAALDWSFDRLTDDERPAFLALGVLPGHFTRATANAVCDGTAPLDALVAKSLVRAENDGFRLLETIGAYALERLAEFGAESAVRERLLERARAIARAGQRAFQVEARATWRPAYQAELDSVRAALSWAFETQAARLRGIELAADMDVIWWDASRTPEGARWIERALELLPHDAPPALRARCWLAAAWLFPDGPVKLEAAERAVEAVADLPDPGSQARAYVAFAQSAQYFAERRVENAAVLERADALAGPVGDAYTLASIVHYRGDTLQRGGDYAGAVALYTDAIERYRAIGDERGVAFMLANLAEGAVMMDDLPRARALAAEALEAMRRLGERRFAALLLANAAMYDLAAGTEIAQARAHAFEGYEIARECALPMESAVFVAIFAALAAQQGDHEASARLYGCARRLYREGDYTLDHTEALMLERLEVELRAELPERLDALCADGAASDPHELVMRSVRGAPS
ncbi:MAG TPA: BTAD domain-containing putative transcriptional regulator [Candidatus Sulfotelmatobacter sp.]|nr:BTAD domain-containing putative transcriptional regulator [Candidatus Sulfotelmatobacter sp.]